MLRSKINSIFQTIHISGIIEIANFTKLLIDGQSFTNLSNMFNFFLIFLLFFIIFFIVFISRNILLIQNRVKVFSLKNYICNIGQNFFIYKCINILLTLNIFLSNRTLYSRLGDMFAFIFPFCLFQ